MSLIAVALAATVAGSLLAPYYLVPQVTGWAAFGVCLLAYIRWRNHTGPALLFLLLGFFLLANLRYPLQFPTDSFTDQLERQSQKLTVTAELKDLHQLAGERSQLDLQVIRLENEKVLLPAAPLSIRVYVDERLTELLPGDLLRFKARLRKPRLFGTPGEFHWPRYLASQGIAMTGWLKSAEQFSVVGRTEPFPDRTIMAWKRRVAELIATSVPQDQALLLRALTLGEARLLPDAVRQKLSRAGISHLFAISGLHLGLLGMLGYRLLLSLYRRSTSLLNWQPPQRILPGLLLPLLLGYLLLTGDAVSTRRAFCVAALAAGFWLWRYTVNPLRLLMTLALVFLLGNPLLLWQPGWQLSFAGAGGILLWKPIWQEKTAALPTMLRGPVRLMAVTSAATLATLPLILVNFHLLAPAGLFANLIAVPIVALLVLPLGVCGLLFSGLPVVATVFFSCSGFLLETTLLLVEKLLMIPGFSGHYLFLTDGQYLAVGILAVPFLLVVQPPMVKYSPYILSGSLLLVLLCACLPSHNSSGLSLVMFSVGQGDSFLLTNNQQQAVLVDGGGLYSDRFDVGERLLAPALGKLGVRHLSAVLLTHDHPDHRKGLVFVLRQFPVDEFWSGVAFADLDPQLKQVLMEKNIPVRRFPSGWSRAERWRQGAMQLFRLPKQSTKNDSSLVLYLESRSGGLLLTGDLEKNGVNRLLSAGLPGPVSILKLPHHGSRHSDSEHLIRALHPEICIVSAGANNRYGFPARQLVAYLQEKSIPLYRTDIMGTVRVRNLDGDWQVEHWESGLFH